MSPTTVSPKLLVWGEDCIEHNTILQAEKTARLPFVAGHVALMPDAHVGIGATIGSVIPTQGAIIPAAVGVDIGCGMIAARTGLRADQLPDDLGPLLFLFETRIPSGVGKGHDWADAPKRVFEHLGVPNLDLSNKQKGTVISQFGTLGSGNHFVELCLDEDDDVWLVLHSGSRGIGNQLAKIHIDKAKGLMKQYFVTLEDPDLAYLSQGSPEFDAYISDMRWAQAYAFASRELMMTQALDSLFKVVGGEWSEWKRLNVETINCHHNFTQREHHHGKNIWVTRKGAIKAAEGDRGVIPGSMGTRTYIVKGKGSAGSYNSCSHGAGRRMSRSQARRELSVDEFKGQMEGRVWQEDKAKTLLDEAPGSYKDIDRVMAAQEDLVEVEHVLHQVLNYKGA